jgi:oligopeptide transport system ATP-binding protein
MAKAILEIENLTVEFHTDDGTVCAVNDLSYSLQTGEILGVVGESGSGKSVSCLAMLGLIPQPPGKIVRGTARYQNMDLLQQPKEILRTIRGKKIAMIFQDPMTALNPYLTVGEQLMEMTQTHLRHTNQQAKNHAIEMLEQVGIPNAPLRLNAYPHEFSGGMRQRVMIAIALSCRPDILIADEPTTALDVTIQAQILDLLRQLQKQHGTAIILITHALGVVANVCERVLVMYGGRIVEEASVNALFAQPYHPYTYGLLKSIPRHNDGIRERLLAIDGQPPNMMSPPPGCAFEPRCMFRQASCEIAMPPLQARPEGGQHRCLYSLPDLLKK